MKRCFSGLLAVSLLAGCASFSSRTPSNSKSTGFLDRRDAVVVKSSLPIGEIKGNFQGMLRVDVVEFSVRNEVKRERLIEVSQGASSALLNHQECDALIEALDEMSRENKAVAPFSSQRQSFKASSGISLWRFQNNDDYSCRIDIKPDGVVWIKVIGFIELKKLLLAAKQKF